MTAMVAYSAEIEHNRNEANAYLLIDSPNIFETERLTTDHDKPLGNHAISLVNRGYPIENLIAMEGFNNQVSALSRFSNLLGLNLYLAPMAAPHQLGEVLMLERLRHTAIRNFLKQLENEWATAKTRGARRKLQADIDNAISTLAK